MENHAPRTTPKWQLGKKTIKCSINRLSQNGRQAMERPSNISEQGIPLCKGQSKHRKHISFKCKTVHATVLIK